MELEIALHILSAGSRLANLSPWMFFLLWFECFECRFKKSSWSHGDKERPRSRLEHQILRDAWVRGSVSAWVSGMQHNLHMCTWATREHALSRASAQLGFESESCVIFAPLVLTRSRSSWRLRAREYVCRGEQESNVNVISRYIFGDDCVDKTWYSCRGLETPLHI